jgi:hypothetical protein
MLIVEKVAAYRKQRAMNKAAIDRAIKGIVLVRAIEKVAKGRCWDGYAYSDGSCQPAGGKKKKKSEKAAEFALNTKDITKGNTAAAGALLGGGLGAGAGALQALIQRALSKKDEEEQPSILNRALMGGIAGGGAGAAGGYLGAPALQGVAKNLAGNPLAGMR